MGVSAYIAYAANRRAAAHAIDVAHLYRLAMEKHRPGASYNAVAEEGVALREIAEVIGTGLRVTVVSLSPEEAKFHLG